jgi:hypothetical protein
MAAAPEIEGRRAEIRKGRGGLSGLLHPTALDAVRADSHTLRRAFHKGANGLQIDVPAAFRYVVGVADAVTELRAATTDFTFFGHGTEIS